MKSVHWCLGILAAGLGLLTSAAHAGVVVWDNADETTTNNNFGGNTNARGVWFTLETGVVDNRTNSNFPSPLFEDGKFLLIWDTQFNPAEAEIWTEGLFANGNQVFGSGGNPAKFSTADSIGAGNYVAAGFTDLGPNFGNWELGDYGFAGLRFRGSDLLIHYGFAEIRVNEDASITLYSFGYESVAGASITPVSSVPEPASMSVLALSMIGLGARRRGR